jgi:magnesium chelatase family protein
MSRVHGAALYGVDGVAVEVEVRISSLLPRIDIVGLPEAAVRESASRVRAAVGSIGAAFPDRRVTVSLAPASLRKTGAGLDLPIAIGILGASGALGDASLEDSHCLESSRSMVACARYAAHWRWRSPSARPAAGV